MPRLPDEVAVIWASVFCGGPLHTGVARLFGLERAVVSPRIGAGFGAWPFARTALPEKAG